MFSCKTVDDLSSWRINGTSRGGLPPAVRSDLEFSPIVITDEGNALLKLTVLARAEYNNTRVQCATVTSGGSVASETAILKVQGIIYVSIYSVNKCLQ